VITILEPKPRRVRSIFICRSRCFCASSRTMKESFNDLPLM